MTTMDLRRWLFFLREANNQEPLELLMRQLGHLIQSIPAPSATEAPMVVLDILKTLSVFCAVTGTMPLSIVERPNVSLKVSTYRSVWTFVLAVLTFCNVYATPSFFINFSDASLIDIAAPSSPSSNSTDQSGSKHDDKQIIILKILNPSIIFIMSLSSHFVAIFCLRTQLPHFVCGYLAVNRKLTKLTKTQLHSKHHMVYLYAVMFFPVPTLGFYIYTVSNQTLMKFSWSLAQVFHNLTSYSCEMQLFLFCHALGIGFRRINDSFPVRSGKDLIWQHTWLHPRDSIFGDLERISVPQIVLAQDCYLRLCKLLTHLNTMYSIQILFSMSGCFIKALLNVYFAFFGAHLPSDEATLFTQRQVDIIKTISWTIYYALRFVALAMVATSTTDEAEKTKFVISSLNYRRTEPSIKEALHIFWKNASSQGVRLTGCGLFTLKSTAILSAFSAGMTYLFILIQYKLQIYFP